MRYARVLVVEDDEINRQVALKILQRAGLEVILANDGAEGSARVLESVEARPFDAVLMDLRMPVLDGWDATRRIKADPRFTGLPVIALTADAISGVRESCLAVGMCDFVTKPFEPAVLIATLARWIRKPGRGVPAAVPAEVPGGVASLPGLDVDLGVSRVGGDPTLYRQLLSTFPRLHGDAAQRMGELAAEGRREEAIRLAHTIKGLAGTFGALALQETARVLEGLLIRQGPGFEEAHRAFREALGEVVDGLRSLAAPPLDAPPSGPGRPKEAIVALRVEVARLKRLVESNDIEAAAASLELSREIAGSTGSEEARALADTLEVFDFGKARDCVAALALALETDPKEEPQNA